MLNKVFKWLFNNPSIHEQILANATDLADLERKQRALMRKGIYL